MRELAINRDNLGLFFGALSYFYFGQKCFLELIFFTLFNLLATPWWIFMQIFPR
jgi:hypothetical protein